MRYRTRIYHRSDDYPRTLKTHLPAGHEVGVEFNAFVVTVEETRDGRLKLKVEANQRLNHQWIALPGLPPVPGYEVELYLVDEEGRPRGSLHAHRKKAGQGRTPRKSLESG